MKLEIMAGEEGLEPSHAGIKIRCLDQLGDSPTLTENLSDVLTHINESKQPRQKNSMLQKNEEGGY